MPTNPVDRWKAELAQVGRERWPELVDANSGLPGPRANTSLATALSHLADPPLIEEFLDSGDEYRTFCGAVALGARVGEPGVTARLRSPATDARWRVREGVVMGMQVAAETDFELVESVVLEWACDADPLIARAAVATICEPRLLVSPSAAAAAIKACSISTAALVAVPGASRRSPAVRTLRRALGYCWSVAVAADPEPGLAAFGELQRGDDPDIAWIVRSNLSKKRMARLVG
ncbi:HEAT repeat domain-containing protein [Gordonia rubripertincta]|uniref:HEAT repeat domain-containing protein n=1 Tax=Gordonia rubripertincta TaxID=36822 RepID=UPI000B8D998F|nr:HEAT repeat domain-containing protein [Gordonia rubripertincta]ASR01148.1 hypothetical protein GCWB2_01590 [Gordonia rubripertincta]